MNSFKLAVATVLICVAGTTGAAQAQTALGLIPLAPCRIADTRDANGPFGGPYIGAHSSRSFVIPNSACGVSSTATAYSLNVTVIPKSYLGYLTIWPTGLSQPVVSTLNSTDGRVKANAAIVPAGTDGAISIYVTDDSDVVLDINGYFVPATNPSALAFFPLTPCRIADTRDAGGTLGGPSLAGAQERSFPVLSSDCSIPSSAVAYSLNFTAVPPHGLGFLSAWPSGITRPLVSTLNAPTGQVTANAAIVPAGTGGAVSLYASSDANVIIDVNGYFAAPASGQSPLWLYPLTPCRVLDTRDGNGLFYGTITDDTSASPCGVPSTSQAVVLNATVVPAESLSFLSLWPSGLSQPWVSTLNAIDALVTSNMAIVPTSSGAIDAYATSHTQLVLDTTGYFGGITSGVANGELSGHYAFSLQGFDSNGNLVTMAGSLVADGSGSITGGFEDRYAGDGSSVGGALTGSYAVGADHRGTITLTTSQESHTFNFALGRISSGVAAQGRVMESDSEVAAGLIKKQDTSAFSGFAATAANFAFGGRGQNGNGRTAVAGRTAMNGSGGFVGMMDFVDPAGTMSGQAIGGSYAVGDTTNGRGTMTFTSPVTMTFAFYIVSANEVFIIDNNPAGAYDGPLTMTGLKQDASFPAPTDGTVSVLHMDGVGDCPQGVSGSRAELDFLQWGTEGNGTVSGDENDCGSPQTNSPQAVTYTVAANGRVTTTGGNHPPVFYLVSSTEGFLVGTNVSSVEAGFMEPQVGSNFSNASVSGDYFFGTQPLAAYGSPNHGSVGVGVITADGNGHVSGTNDFNGGGSITTDTFNDTISVSASGRATTSNSVMYLVSSSKAIMIDGGDDNTPRISVTEK